MNKLLATAGLWFSMLFFGSASAVTLGASSFATYVDAEGEPARLNAIVEEAFSRMGEDLQLEVMRQAFLGSGLLSGDLDGEFAFIDLGSKKSSFLYSESYLPLLLYVSSKSEDVKQIRLIPHLDRNRVAIENRFANTPKFRLIKDIKWSRNPSSFDAFRQLADDRAPYLMTSYLLVDEFNRLLRADGEEMLHYSAAPLVKTSFHISLSTKIDNAAQLLADFNDTIKAMQTDGTYNRLLGVTWLTQDTDGDGIAEYITSTDVTHAKIEPGLLTLAYSLDGKPVGDNANFIVDGKRFATWSDAKQALQTVTPSLRPSLLDPDVYKRMIQRW